MMLRSIHIVVFDIMYFVAVFRFSLYPNIDWQQYDCDQQCISRYTEWTICIAIYICVCVICPICK